ncbi:carbohydrate-binding family 9-like protein [Olivibacter sitiensis]|uniref:carbohydrate-binding family 9-like protein n=1 Tax=Olivibacter sitiensis TaxID=376470 RepID=UPI00042984F1|nr:carbohydrate-binding family 9-like protein [Olivibacter sitiensis]
MKKLIVPFIDTSGAPVEDFTKSLEMSALQRIAYNPWPQYLHEVDAHFAIAHDGDTICLKYVIEEYHVKANASSNGGMHKDSCVEFFIAFDSDRGNYYNLEFNCLGYCKIAYGSRRVSRRNLPLSLVESIPSYGKIDSACVNGRKRFVWEIVLLIPRTVFCYTPLDSLKGKEARANFYKCGDSLHTPHFLAWNNIALPKPDFHAPEFFGKLHFG